jgi:hypothetical protein
MLGQLEVELEVGVGLLMPVPMPKEESIVVFVAFPDGEARYETVGGSGSTAEVG